MHIVVSACLKLANCLYGPFTEGVRTHILSCPLWDSKENEQVDFRKENEETYARRREWWKSEGQIHPSTYICAHRDILMHVLERHFNVNGQFIWTKSLL